MKSGFHIFQTHFLYSLFDIIIADVCTIFRQSCMASHIIKYEVKQTLEYLNYRKHTVKTDS